MLHPPQLSGLFEGFTQAPLQQSRPAPHGPPHAPASWLPASFPPLLPASSPLLLPLELPPELELLPPELELLPAPELLPPEPLLLELVEPPPLELRPPSTDASRSPVVNVAPPQSEEAPTTASSAIGRQAMSLMVHQSPHRISRVTLVLAPDSQVEFPR
jgi:hypothetical protein